MATAAAAANQVKSEMVFSFPSGTANEEERANWSLWSSQTEGRDFQREVKKDKFPSSSCKRTKYLKEKVAFYIVGEKTHKPEEFQIGTVSGSGHGEETGISGDPGRGNEALEIAEGQNALLNVIISGLGARYEVLQAWQDLNEAL